MPDPYTQRKHRCFDSPTPSSYVYVHRPRGRTSRNKDHKLREGGSYRASSELGMAGLQRSSETFRRSGSSGMVWEDKHQSASGELGETKRQGKGAPAARLQRNGSSGYRAAHVQPALDPPSPRVAVCGFCSLFGKDKQAPRASGNAKGKRR